jgi:hypothetical protein
LPAWVAVLIDLLQTALGLIGVVQNQTKTAAQENVPFSIDTLVNEYLPIIGDSAVGLAALKAELLIIDAHLATVDASLAASIALAQTAALPVILPSTAPTGYGGATAGDVWALVDPTNGHTEGELLATAGMFPLWFRGDSQTLVPSSSAGEGWMLQGDFANSTDTEPSMVGLVPVQLDSILATDATYSDWLTRVTSGMSFTLDNGRAYYYPGSGDWYWYCAFSSSDFTMYQATVLGVGRPPLAVAPVWPGLALVTLGTPVTITTAFTIAQPLHGVIVTLTAEPSKSSFYSFDGVNSYRNLGALSFTSDDGQQEASTSLGFTSGIYTPRTMALAAGVKVRTVGGVAGTVTPWVIT